MPEFHRERQRIHWAFHLIMFACTLGPILLIAFTAKPGDPQTHQVLWMMGTIDFIILVPLWVMFYGMTTVVTPEAIVVRYGSLGWPKWQFTRADLEAYRVVSFSPLKDFGGWGIRYGSGNRMCINASGNRGVQLQVKGAKRIYIIGSDNPEQLAGAIRMAFGLQPETDAPAKP
jgi:hypothetical protein